MGDNPSTPTERRPGIAIVRPKLHEDTQENRDLFRRWTKLHIRDALSVPENQELGRASKVLRYTRATEEDREEYFYTIVVDDVRLPGTKEFHDVPQRLDLENTRALKDGEEPVLRPGDARIGTEPMVFSIIAPVVGIFEAAIDTETVQTRHKSYQDLPAEFVTAASAPGCTLVTLTISLNKEIPTPSQRMQRFRTSLVDALIHNTNQLVYATLYRHASDVQPAMLPKIPQGQDGNGEWVVCVLLAGDVEAKVSDLVLDGVDGQLQAWSFEGKVREWRERLESEGSLDGLDMQVGVWKGDIFMSR